VIDTHCHPLPFLDDGAKNWEVALEMARMAVRDGINECVTTPHWTDLPEGTESTSTRLAEFREKLAAEEIPLTLHPGNEVILVPSLLDALKEGRALTLAGTSYILLETAQLERGAFNQPAIFRLQASGYRVILAHPERVPSWEKDLSEVRTLVERGCYLQINAQSLTGGFGRGPRAAAERFIKMGWASLLGTDAHSASGRPPILSQALGICSQWIGEPAARKLVEDNPRRLLANRNMPYVDTERELPKRRLFSFPWQR
jgi:protein-tyrosine phosphatase